MFSILKHDAGDFAGGPVVKTLPSNAEEVGLIPGWGAKFHRHHGQKTKIRSSIVVNSIKTLKIVHIKKSKNNNKPTMLRQLRELLNFRCRCRCRYRYR